MAYNSAYTGSQVDAAVGAVRQKETKWDNKQDELTGTEDQLVGFNSAGEATAVPKPTAADVGAMPAVSGGTTGQVLTKGDGETVEWSDPSSGLPSGGTPGQMLYQGESGAEWGDKPVMYVTITGDEESGYQADKTAAEISQAVQNGYSVFAIVYMNDANLIVPVAQTNSLSGADLCVFSAQLLRVNVFIQIVTGGNTTVVVGNIGAGSISFTPGTTGLTADNVQDAIEEVNEKIPSAPKSVTVTLPASGWSSNTQTVTVSGVLANETAQLIQPMPAVASQNAYISAGVICSGQAANQLTFTCTTVPTEDLSVYVVIQGVSA